MHPPREMIRKVLGRVDPERMRGNLFSLSKATPFDGGSQADGTAQKSSPLTGLPVTSLISPICAPPFGVMQRCSDARLESSADSVMQSCLVLWVDRRSARIATYAGQSR